MPLLEHEGCSRSRRARDAGDDRARAARSSSPTCASSCTSRARYRNRGLPMLDLIEEGNLGLIHAGRPLRARARPALQHLRRRSGSASRSCAASPEQSRVGAHPGADVPAGEPLRARRARAARPRLDASRCRPRSPRELDISVAARRAARGAARRACARSTRHRALDGVRAARAEDLGGAADVGRAAGRAPARAREARPAAALAGAARGTGAAHPLRVPRRRRAHAARRPASTSASRASACGRSRRARSRSCAARSTCSRLGRQRGHDGPLDAVDHADRLRASTSATFRTSRRRASCSSDITPLLGDPAGVPRARSSGWRARRRGPTRWSAIESRGFLFGARARAALERAARAGPQVRHLWAGSPGCWASAGGKARGPAGAARNASESEPSSAGPLHPLPRGEPPRDSPSAAAGNPCGVVGGT